MRTNLLIIFIIVTCISADAQKILSLSESIDYCLNFHPSISISNHNVNIAKEKSKQALAVYLPQVSGNGVFVDNTKLQTTVLPAGILGPEAKQIALGTQFNNNASLDVSQTIYDQSKLTAIKANKPYAVLTELQKQQNLETIVYNASVAYFQVLIYKEQVKSLEANRVKYEDMIKILSNQLTNGVVMEKDLDRVKVSLSSTNYQIEDARTKLQLALNNLKYTIGMPLESPIVVVDSLNYELFALTSTRDNLDLLSLTPVKIKTANIELDKYSVKAKEAAFIPTVSAFGKLATQSLSNTFSDAFSTWNSYNYFGISVYVPIFNGGKRRSLVYEERLNLLNDVKDFEITKESLKLKFENAKAAVGSSFSSYSSNRENLELSRKVVALTEFQYQKGTASLSDYLNDDTAYKNAQSNYINSLYNLMLSQLNYQQAQGTLLSFLKQIR